MYGQNILTLISFGGLYGARFELLQPEQKLNFGLKCLDSGEWPRTVVALFTSKWDVPMEAGATEKARRPCQKCSGAAEAYRRPSKGLRTSQIMSEDFSQADTVAVSAVTDTDCTGQVWPATAARLRHAEMVPSLNPFFLFHGTIKSPFPVFFAVRYVYVIKF